MLIRNLQVINHISHREIRARIGPYPLWFRHNDLTAENETDASPFLISALIPAMLLGENIEVHDDLSVSTQLLESIPTIQTIINHWNPIFKPIVVNSRSYSNMNSASERAAFFSAGVDSLYTAIRHSDKLNALILINGFDFNMDSITWQDMVARNNELAQLLNKRLILVETNLKEFTSWFRLSRYANFGASLATVANLLNIAEAHISGHVTYDKISPAGAHPLLDPLWSTEGCSIFHTGLEADRTGKLELIKHSPVLLSKLWVCWKNPKNNCGECSKCIRSYLAMQLCGIDNFNFEHSVHLDQVRKLTIEDDEMLSFFENFRKDALDRDMHELSKTLSRVIFRYKTRKYFLDIDKFLLGSKLKRLRNTGKTAVRDLADISVLPRVSDRVVLGELRSIHQERSAVNSTESIGTVF